MDNEITATAALPKLNYKYELIIDKDYGKVFLLPESKIIICELIKEYVPIEDFKSIFNEITSIIKENKIKKFIFDKQNLRVFHQPSMEWYFVEWKKEIYEMGMATHRKILPQNDMVFKIAVQAGREQILLNYKNTIIEKLDIQYKTSIEEAIES